jgi:pimeloyl-ACP methyl ester carboxylesterase
MIGLLVLLVTALALLIVLLTALLVREMRHPPRHTAGYAVARGLAVDPGELGLAFEEWNLERPGGVTLPVWEIASPHSRTQDPKARLTAVLIHGWGHSRVDTLARVEPLLEHCDRLTLFDLRGHGEATGASALGDGEADDLAALLEALGPGRFLLVGHSMGAVIAIAAAAGRAGEDLRARIAGVVAYGPYCDFHSSLRGRLAVAGYPGRPMTDLALWWLRIRGIRPLSLTEADAGSLRCPLLIMHGEEDQVAPLTHSERLVAAAPCATLRVVPGAGHVDLHSADEANHAAAIEEFIASLRHPPVVRPNRTAQADAPA